jgi:hypothetical protein
MAVDTAEAGAMAVRWVNGGGGFANW